MIELETRDNKYVIVIVGVGGTGSHLISFLSQYIGTLRKNIPILIIDQDIVEAKNCRNQKFLECDVGKKKAEVLAARYKSIYPYLDIRFIDKFILKANDLLNPISTYTRENCKTLPIIVGCVDNNTTRKILNEVFYKLKSCIYIDTGNGAEERKGQCVIGYHTFNYLNEVDEHNAVLTKNKRILDPVCDVYPEILEAKNDIDGLGCSHVVDKYPQNIATNIASASMVFNHLINIIQFQQIASHITYFNCEKDKITYR